MRSSWFRNGGEKGLGEGWYGEERERVGNVRWWKEIKMVTTEETRFDKRDSTTTRGVDPDGKRGAKGRSEALRDGQAVAIRSSRSVAVEKTMLEQGHHDSVAEAAKIDKRRTSSETRAEKVQRMQLVLTTYRASMSSSAKMGPPKRERQKVATAQLRPSTHGCTDQTCSRPTHASNTGKAGRRMNRRADSCKAPQSERHVCPAQSHIGQARRGSYAKAWLGAAQSRSRLLASFASLPL